MKVLSNRFPYLYSTICIVVIIILCLFWVPPHSKDLDKIEFVDKWVHALMYVGTCFVMCMEYRYRTRFSFKWFLSVFILMTLFGGIIEICQETFTITRSAEWADLAADAVGTLVGLVIGYFFAPLCVRLIKK